MIKGKQIRIVVAILIAAIVAVGCRKETETVSTDKRLHILCTTFPIYQITRNITQGREGVQVALMLPSQLGCPHDYVLTPQDMQKLAVADVLVVNGLGLEQFLGAPVEKANPRLNMIDSSSGIREIIAFDRDGHHDHHDHDHHDHVEEPNPHLFASPRMAAMLTMNIAAELSRLDPAGASVYFTNARAYADTLNHLALAMAELGQRLKNNRIVQPHGAFDYLARDMGLEIVATTQAHGQEPSASQMLALVATIREKNVGALFVEPQYSDQAGHTISREIGIPVGILDPVASGPEDAPLDYYQSVMRRNMETLQKLLGAQ